MLKMSWSFVCQCAEVEVRIKSSALSRHVRVYFNLHIHNSSHLQTASRGHLLTQDYQSTRGPSGCALRKISAKGMSLSFSTAFKQKAKLCRAICSGESHGLWAFLQPCSSSCSQSARQGRESGNVFAALQRPVWLRAALHVFQWGICDARTEVAENGETSGFLSLCSTQTLTELSLWAAREEQCLVIVVQRVHWALLWGSWGRSVGSWPG